MLLLILFLPALGGCWWDHWTRHDDSDDDDQAGKYYLSEPAGNTVGAYNHGVALEIPNTPPPLTATNPEAAEKWPMTLQQALEIALQNSGVVRQLRGGVAVAVATRFDPALAETRINQELARFDTQFIFNLFWGRDDIQLNSNVAPGGGTVGVSTGTPFIFKQDTFGSTAARNSGLAGTGDVLSLRKLLGNGAEVTVGFNTDYSLSNVPAANRAFRAAYDSRVSTTFRQPLLAQAGQEVNRAPIVIARLRADQEVWQFKTAMAGLVQQVEQAYWQLYEAQWQYWAAGEALKANLEVVKLINEKLKQGAGNASDLNEANVQYWAFARQREFAISGSDLVQGTPVVGVLVREGQLRSLLGLPVADGKRIIAADDPHIAPFEWDWNGIKLEAFTYNPEIQRLKLAIAEQNQVVLIRRNGLLPRLDVFGRKEWTGLGGELDESEGTLSDGEFGSYTIGAQLQIDIGYRRAAAQLEEALHQLRQARVILQAKGQEIEHTLTQHIRELVVRFNAFKTSVEQRLAARAQLDIQRELFEDGKITIDRLLVAVRGYTDAVRTEIQDKVEYQIALSNLETAKGTIFKYNNIHIHEDAWTPAAYASAARQAADRDRAIEWHHAPQCPPELENISVYDQIYSTEPRKLEQPPAPTSDPQASVRDPRGPTEIPVDLALRNRSAKPLSVGVPIQPVSPASTAPIQPAAHAEIILPGQPLDAPRGDSRP